MNHIDARTVLGILVTADHGCESCARHLFAKFLKKYPGNVSEAKSIWREAFDSELKDSDLQIYGEDDF